MAKWARRSAACVSLCVTLGCDISTGLEGWEAYSLSILLSGTVTASADGAPVEGATVEPISPGSLGFFGFGNYAESAVTDADGRYALEVRCNASDGPRCPDIDFVAHLDRFDGGSEPRVETLRARRSVDSLAVATLDFTLRPTRPIVVVVEGHVRSAPAGAPTPGASVVLYRLFWPFDQDSTATDALGAYRIESAGHCALDGGSCTFGAVRLQAWDGAAEQVTDLAAVDVPGDTLFLPLTFDDLR